jgi:hypothetical protein
MYEILKDFNFSTNGIEIVSLKKGDTFNFTTDSINGLIQEGFLKPIEIETKIVENIETKPLKIKKDKGE